MTFRCLAKASAAQCILAKRRTIGSCRCQQAFRLASCLYVSFVEIFYKGFDALARLTRYWDWINAHPSLRNVSDRHHRQPDTNRLRNRMRLNAERNRTTPRPTAPMPDSRRSLRLSEGDSRRPRPCGNRRKLLRMGLFTALAIAIHTSRKGCHIPCARETRAWCSDSMRCSATIPEGISVSVPISTLLASQEAFIYSFLSGLAEPVGGDRLLGAAHYVGVKWASPLK